MNIEKIRNLTDAELAQQEREIGEQLFKLKFQLKMGQTESLNKIRTLRKDVARVKTVAREKQIALGNGSAAAAVEIAGVEKTEEDKAVSVQAGAKGSAKNAAARKKTAARKTTRSKQEKK